MHQAVLMIIGIFFYFILSSLIFFKFLSDIFFTVKPHHSWGNQFLFFFLL
jgi:hypothetical protein